MIIYLLLKIMVFFYNLVHSLLYLVFPIKFSELGIESQIDSFYNLFEDYSTFALNGAYFLLGDFVIGLATAAAALYVFYYTVYIPLRFVLKIFIH